MGSGAFWLVLVVSGEFWWVLVGFGEFWWVLVGSGAFWWVLVGSGEFWWVLVGSGEFWWVPMASPAAIPKIRKSWKMAEIGLADRGRVRATFYKLPATMCVPPSAAGPGQVRDRMLLRCIFHEWD